MSGFCSGAWGRAHHDRELGKHGGAVDRDGDRGPAAAARCGTGAREPTWHLRRWNGLELRTQLRCRRDAMNRMIGLVALCLALGACASTRPAPDIALDESVEIEAVPASEAPAPVRVVEVPTPLPLPAQLKPLPKPARQTPVNRSEEHTSELQTLIRTSYAVFCLNKKNKHKLEFNIKKKEIHLRYIYRTL